MLKVTGLTVDVRAALSTFQLIGYLCSILKVKDALSKLLEPNMLFYSVDQHPKTP